MLNFPQFIIPKRVIPLQGGRKTIEIKLLTCKQISISLLYVEYEARAKKDQDSLTQVKHQSYPCPCFPACACKDTQIFQLIVE